MIKIGTVSNTAPVEQNHEGPTPRDQVLAAFKEQFNDEHTFYAADPATLQLAREGGGPTLFSFQADERSLANGPSAKLWITGALSADGKSVTFEIVKREEVHQIPHPADVPFTTDPQTMPRLEPGCWGLDPDYLKWVDEMNKRVQPTGGLTPIQLNKEGAGRPTETGPLSIVAAAGKSAVPTSKERARAAIAAAFEADFPPRQSRILEPDLSSLELTKGKRGKWTFSMTAAQSAGGVAGPVALGNVTISGVYDVASGKVTFDKV